MSQKVVYNSCYGGFSVSEDAVRWMREQGDDEAERIVLEGEQYDSGSIRERGHDSYGGLELSRTNENLVALVEGSADFSGVVSGSNASLQIAEVPDSVEWRIDEYDGKETVRERSKTF